MSPPLRASALSRIPAAKGLDPLIAAAFRASPVAMLVADQRRPEHPILFANEAFAALTGYAPEEVVGRACFFLEGPDTAAADAERIREAFDRGTAVEAEVLHYRESGVAFWNALSVRPLRDEGGRLRAFVVACADVGERRTAGGAEPAGDLKAALDRAGVLLQETEHRVKNNLQIVSSLMLLKARRVKEPAAQRVLNNMAERISALATVQSLLHPSGDVSRFDIGAFVGELSADLLEGAGPGQIELSLDLEPVGVSAAKAAPVALVVNELVSNALRHAFPDGRKGRLALTARRREEALRIVVEDDGIGLQDAAVPEESFGRTLAEMLARQVRGTLVWEDARPGTRAVFEVPLVEEAVNGPKPAS